MTLAEKKCLEMIERYENFLEKIDRKIHRREIFYDKLSMKSKRSFFGILFKAKTDRMIKKAETTFYYLDYMQNNFPEFVKTYYTSQN